MSYLQKARENKDLTQNEVTERTGVSRPQLQRLEAGQVVASPEQASALRQQLGIAILESKNVPEFSEVRKRAGIKPYRLESVDPQPWKTARASWLLPLATEIWDWISQFLPADSAREGYAWAQCAVAGARPFLGNPHQWGFDRLAVVDREGRLLGARLLPGLSYSSGDIDLVVWPQVCLRIDDRHCYRVDGLMFFRLGRKRFWLSLEYDCEGHNFARDAYRRAKIGLPEVRITGEEIKQRRTFSLLIERAKAAAGL